MAVVKSRKQEVARIKLTLKLIVCALILLLSVELALSPFNHTEVAFLVMLASVVLLYFWTNEDTIQVIGGLLLWGASTLIFYLTWVNFGLFSIAPLVYPCIILLAIVIGNKFLFVPLIICILIQVLLVYLGQFYGIIGPYDMDNTNITVRTINIFIVLLLFSIITYIFIKNYNNQLRKVKAEKAQYAKQLKKSQNLLMHDPLTHLPNEHICYKDIKPLIKEAQEKHSILAFMVLDIINLRQINHSFGHTIGDLLLVEIANRLNALLQDEEYLYRFNGREFILVKSTHDRKEIEIFKDRVLQAIATEFTVAEYEISALCSIGIALAPFDGDSVDNLRVKAHMALQYAKSKQKITAQYFKPDIKEKIDDKYFYVTALKNAIKNNQFFVYYQPKVNLEDNKIIGVEALVRWHHPEKGWIPPNIFIPIAEEASLISDITKFVITTACRDCIRWQKLGYSDISVAINLSAVDFKRGALPQLIFTELKQSGMSPHLLELEITESTIFDDIEHIQAQIHQLQQKGISFAIDDFGTGYSNLGYLDKFNVSVLKIDQSFVKKIAVAEHEQHIVNAIITLSDSLDIINVSEGIEDKQTADWLLAAGCQIGQGFYWYKPMPFEQLIEALENEK